MKYLKTYDGLSNILYKYFKNRSDKFTKYKRNTYVLTTDGKIGRIGAVDHSKFINNVEVNSYWIENDRPDLEDPYSESDIVREATPEEIEQYKLQQTANKYNL